MPQKVSPFLAFAYGLPKIHSTFYDIELDPCSNEEEEEEKIQHAKVVYAPALPIRFFFRRPAKHFHFITDTLK